jgi:transketolase C-terminal domain/subunit
MITLGSIASEAVAVIDSLASQGISCTLMVASSIIPPPLPTLVKTLPHFRQVMTVEAHYINGGIGSLVSEFAAEGNFDFPLPLWG